jgi:preprotein translocase subunit SecG
MSNVLLISHLIVTVLLILVVLFQRSEGGGLGMGSDNQGFGTGTKSANPLSKLTWFLTALFFLIAILLTILSINSGSNKSVFEESEGAEDSDKKELTPELPDLKKFKSTDGVLTPPTE